MNIRHLITFSATVLSATLFALEFKQDGRDFVFTAKRTQVKVANAKITEVRNLKSGTAFASSKTPARSMTAGIGTMAGGRSKEMSKLHFPWGEPTLKQSLPPVEKTQLYRAPDARSAIDVSHKGGSVTVTWKGLTDSVDFFPNDSITAVFAEDASGALTITSTAKTSDKGIFGFQFPIENIDGKGKFGLATFGGMEYDASGTPALLTFLDSGLFYEAKIMTYTIGDSSMGYWYEDPEFRPYFVMLGRGYSSASFAIEINSIMPYEARDTLSTPPLKIDTFDDADWLAAATPYRKWYRKTFADDIARRDSIEWANEIYAISDNDIPNDVALDEMAKIVPPENTLLQNWNARKPNFDTKLPDYEPRESYIANVKRAHAKGFKTMCYVCSLCANYNCEVWKRDKLSDFVLTRKNNLTNYHGTKNVFNEGLMGTLNAAKGDDQFANLKPEQLIYTDPLSERWRNYFSNAVIKMNATAGTDANYQDTLGCTADNGNGFVDGFAGAQGNMLLARLLAKKLPNVPMASEFGPEPIAFAIHWPLNYTTVWGTPEFRNYRMHRQFPLSAYLFGYRPWIPILRMGDDTLRHVGTACSDALGGLGFFSPSAKLTMKDGFIDHLNYRSHIFAKHGLKPYFPKKRYEKNVKAMYIGKDGKIFSYSDDGFVQCLRDGDGRALYARVNGVGSVSVSGLTLPGWPAIEGSLISGLSPKQSYALFPADSSEKSEITLGSLPEGTVVRYFYAADNYAYIELNGQGSIALKPTIPSKFTEIYVNDERCDSTTIKGQLPMRIFLSDGTAVPPEKVRRVNQSSGLAVGPANGMPELRRRYVDRTLFYLYGYNDVVLDAVYDVKSADDTIVFLHKNDQPTYGNAYIITACINGRPVQSFDARPQGKPHERQLRRWAIPVGEFVGKRILFSIRVDNKADNNSDMPFVSQPELIRTNLKEFKETILDPNKIVRPDGTPFTTIVPEFPKTAKLSEGTVKMGPALSTVCSTKTYPADNNAKCVLSGMLSSEDDKTVYLGIIQYDKNSKQIYGEHINRRENATTEFAADAKAGDSYILLKDASNWKTGGYVSTAKGLPCFSFDGTVKNISRQGDSWKLELNSPLKKDIVAGTKAFMHLPTNTHLYVFANKLSKAPAERGGSFEFWPGAVRFQIVLLGQAPVSFKDLRLEMYRK